MHGHEVEDHLPAHRSNTRHARGGYQRGEPEFAREPVPAEGVHGLVVVSSGFGEAGERGFTMETDREVEGLEDVPTRPRLYQVLRAISISP